MKQILNIGEMRLNLPLIFVVVFGMLWSGCDQNPLEVDISNVDTNVEVKRYEQALYSLNKENFNEKLPDLLQEYPAFLMGDMNDELFLKEIRKMVFYPLNQKLYTDLNERISEEQFSQIENELKGLFKHLKYYYPESNIQTVYTYISGLGYEQGNVFVNDSIVVAAIDLFLGADYKVYEQYGLYKYQVKKMTPAHLSVEVARELSKYYIPATEGNLTLLEEMIFEGKIQYFMEAMLPKKPQHVLLEYTPEEYHYCEESVGRLWRYLVEKELLYSKDHMETKRFIEDGPFTSSLERESPGRIGAYVGLQIVKAYVNKTGATLKEVMNETALLNIFEGSKYRP